MSVCLSVRKMCPPLHSSDLVWTLLALWIQLWFSLALPFSLALIWVSLHSLAHIHAPTDTMCMHIVQLPIGLVWLVYFAILKNCFFVCPRNWPPLHSSQLVWTLPWVPVCLRLLLPFHLALIVSSFC